MVYKFLFRILLLSFFIAGATYFFVERYYIIAALVLLPAIAAGFSIFLLYRKTILKTALMFEAIENDDYSFRFKTNTLTSKQNADEALNESLNKMKLMVLNARKEVREREKYFETILNQVNTGIIVLSDAGIVLRVNESALNLLSLSMLSHVNQLSTIMPDMPNLIMELRDGKSTQVKFFNESSLIRLSLTATEIVIQDKAQKIIALTDIFSDIDQAEIDSWSKMSRVFTHEIMNSLAPITAISESLAESDDIEYISKGLEIISSTSQRLMGFVNSYRTLTKLPAPKLEELSLVDLVKSSIGLCGISLNLNVASGDYVVLADYDQISQVIINLLKNAKEAVSVVDNENHDKIWVNIGHDEQGHAFVEVCNSGVEISDEVRENIFVPFFTTKEEGTGIGLSLSRQIMRLHEGSLQLITKPHTCFVLKFS